MIGKRERKILRNRRGGRHGKSGREIVGGEEAFSLGEVMEFVWT